MPFPLYRRSLADSNTRGPRRPAISFATEAAHSTQPSNLHAKVGTVGRPSQAVPVMAPDPPILEEFSLRFPPRPVYNCRIRGKARWTGFRNHFRIPAFRGRPGK